MSQAGIIAGSGGGMLVFTLTGNTGGPVSPLANNINIIGAGGLTITGNPGTGTLTVTGGGASSIDITGDTGGTLTGDSFTFSGGTTGLSFDGAVTTETLSITNLNLPANAVSMGVYSQGIITVGGDRFLMNYGPTNVFLGSQAANTTLNSGTAVFNIGIGYQSLLGLTLAGTTTSVGAFSGTALTSGSANCMYGYNSGSSLTIGYNNTFVGFESGKSITSGFENIFIGKSTGQSNTTTSNSNIYIGNTGIVGVESHTIRIGTHGSTDAQQNTAYMAGIRLAVVSGPQMVTIGSDNQLGSQVFPVGVQWVDETGTSDTMTINAGYVADNAGLVTLTLPSAAVFGSIIEIAGKGSGGWLIAQNSGQTINFGSSPTTTGVTGSLASTNRYDSVKLLCVTTNTTWVVLSSVGNLTVT